MPLRRLAPRLPRTWACGVLLCSAALAQDKPSTVPVEPPVSAWDYSLGIRWQASDLRHPGLSLRPMLGLQYGRWRMGPVDGENWHRFGQVQQDNSLTYDWLRLSNLRTSLSASVVNLERDGSFDAVRSGRKTVRGKASVDYFLPNRWSIGVVMTQDLMERGAGTSLSPNWTYREPLSDNSTLLLSQSVTWGSRAYWPMGQKLNPDMPEHQGQGFGSWDTQLTYRHRFKPHWVFFSQAGFSRAIGPTSAASLPPVTIYSAQLGVLYFSR
jgi:hypothetical protein